MAYPPAADLVAESNVPELTQLPLADQTTLYDSAINQIELYTGQSFTLEAAAVKHLDGHGGRTIGLPQRLVTLTSLAVFNSGLTASDVYVTEDGAELVVGDLAGVSTYYERTLAEMTMTHGMEFTFGTRTVAVTGDWGWTECPEDVATAIRLDMEDSALADANALSHTIRAFRGLGIADISQGNLNVNWALVGPTVSARVVRLLAPYIWTGPVGAMV